MYKMLSIDMDGTLLNDEHKISKENLNSLRMAIDKGCLVVINTGRTFSEFSLYMNELSFVDKFLLCNGALLYEKRENKFTILDSIERCIIEEAFDLSRSYSKKVSLVVSVGKNSYTDKIYKDGIGAKQHFDMCGDILEYVDDLKAILIDTQIEKGVMFGDRKVLELIQSKLNKKFFDKVNVIFSLYNALELIGKNTDKASALKKLSKSFGIDRSEIISIGDGINDLGMIYYSGLGIAMDNACKEIKEKAQFITKNNNENGVSYAIEKFIM